MTQQQQLVSAAARLLARFPERTAAEWLASGSEVHRIAGALLLRKATEK